MSENSGTHPARGLLDSLGRLIGDTVRDVLDSVGGLQRSYELVARLVVDEDGDAKVHFLLRAEDDPSLIVEPSVSGAWWQPVRFVTRNGSEVVSVARRIRRAGRAFPPFARSAQSADPLVVALSPDELADLLTTGARKLANQGVILQLPSELTPEGRARLRASLRIGDEPAVEEALPSWGMGTAATEPFRWELALGDTEISFDEFKAIAEAKRGVVRVRGKWIAVDPGELAEVAKAIGDRAEGTMPAAQAAGLVLAGDLPVTKAVAARVDAIGRVSGLAERVRRVTEERELAEPPGFVGSLRPYQRRGLAWLDHVEEAGLGGILADDMGLGKTVQVIALHLHGLSRAPQQGPTLIVSPASVLPNWERELHRFGPGLQVVRHHGPGRAKRAGVLRARLDPGGVVLTTYGTLRSSKQLLAAVGWHRVVLDEAQNVKNPRAAQTKAAMELPALHRLALTGTPVENRLDDLWSIMQFTNPGLLGPRATFRERFAAPVERGQDGAAERLRRLTRPFLLRRTKSDPEIAVDLPAKVESDVLCELTVEQATLCQAAVDQALADIESSEGMRRRARILTLLTELKQICDHPAVYLHERGPLPDRSGKLDRLTEMLEEVVAESDAALVFTQYTEMARLIVSRLSDSGLDVPLLHGGLSLADREELVDVFQNPAGPPVLVASLRAGGVGLNLTRATHVFHFDRWWNPAVEDQATDRAHRIGQERTVFVHRFSVAGTLEERIGELIEQKRVIAGQVIQPGEGWLTELSTTDLRQLIELR